MGPIEGQEPRGTKRPGEFSELPTKFAKFDVWFNTAVCKDIVEVVCSFLENKELLSLRACSSSYPPIVDKFWKNFTQLDLSQNSFKEEPIKTHIFSKLLYRHIYKNEENIFEKYEKFWNQCPDFKNYFDCLREKTKYDKIVNVKCSDHPVLHLLLRVKEHARRPTLLTEGNLSFEAAKALIAKVRSATFIIGKSNLETRRKWELFLIAAEHGDFEPLRSVLFTSNQQNNTLSLSVFEHHGIRFPPILEAIFYQKCDTLVNSRNELAKQPDQYYLLLTEAFAVGNQAVQGYGKSVPSMLYRRAATLASKTLCYFIDDRKKTLQEAAIPFIKLTIECLKPGTELEVCQDCKLLSNLASNLTGEFELREMLYEKALLFFDRTIQRCCHKMTKDHFCILGEIFWGLHNLSCIQQFTSEVRNSLVDREVELYNKFCKNYPAGTLIDPGILVCIAERLNINFHCTKDNKRLKVCVDQALAYCELAIQGYGTKIDLNALYTIRHTYSNLLYNSNNDLEEQKKIVDRAILYIESIIPSADVDAEAAVGEILFILSDMLDDKESRIKLIVKAIEHYEKGIRDVNGEIGVPDGAGDTCLSLSELVENIEEKRQLLLKTIHYSNHPLHQHPLYYHHGNIAHASYKLSELTENKAEKKKFLEEAIKHYINSYVPENENSDVTLMCSVLISLVELADNKEEQRLEKAPIFSLFLD